MMRIGTWSLLAFLTALLAVPLPGLAQDVDVSFDLFAPPPVAVAPPPLPIYVVPEPPEYEGYVWAPGYWSWDGYEYYWVPGTWIQPPVIGYLWTPGYWGWQNDAYFWHEGYWGQRVGFYGGVNYGGGYGPDGFHGGRWYGHRYVVDHTYINRPTVTSATVFATVSFNGGPGGARSAPTSAQRAAMRAHHQPPTEMQHEYVRQAAQSRELRQDQNAGRPPIAATQRPGDFAHNVPARNAGPANPAAERHNAQIRANPALAPQGAAVPREHAAPIEHEPSERQRGSDFHATPGNVETQGFREPHQVESRQTDPRGTELHVVEPRNEPQHQAPTVATPQASPAASQIFGLHEEPHAETARPETPHTQTVPSEPARREMPASETRAPAPMQPQASPVATPRPAEVHVPEPHPMPQAMHAPQAPRPPEAPHVDAPHPEAHSAPEASPAAASPEPRAGGGGHGEHP